MKMKGLGVKMDRYVVVIILNIFEKEVGYV